MGGGLSHQFERLRPGNQAYMARWAMPAFRDAKVMGSALGQNSGFVGAAALEFLAQRSA